ncbi:hypothetical protein IWW34DRAFT_849010 [Fusarium oxysporum f. sp. albedinis]|nr:hypothetical protein IWW34DRAFT_849010 [Fusarium oxysporum f. sp. albedinis]
MQSVLLGVLFSLQQVGCWRAPGPTAPPSNNNPTARAPAPTKAPSRRADLGLKGSKFSPCARLSGDASVSDNLFYCSADQTCDMGVFSSDLNFWGCCKSVAVASNFCIDPYLCPFFSTCIDSTRLGSCGSDCMTDDWILKCSESAKPFCAIGTALMTGLFTESSVDTLTQFACATYPYSLNYVIFTDNLAPDPTEECAPLWFTGTELEEFENSVDRETTKYVLANPFDQLATRANFSASTALPNPNKTTAAPTVQIPTEPPATSTTTSAAVRCVVSSRNNMYVALLSAGWLWLL